MNSCERHCKPPELLKSSEGEIVAVGIISLLLEAVR